MTTFLPITSDVVPAGFCPIKDSDWQQLVRLLKATFTGDPSVNTGNAKPTPENRSKPWIRSNSDGTPDRTYYFVSGQWASPHPIFVDAVMFYAGDPANIPTLDGGNTNAVSAYDGPFWQVLPNSPARFLVGAGTLPSTAVLVAGTMGGEEQHELLLAEMPSHTHNMTEDQFAIADAAGALLARPARIAVGGLVAPSPTSATGGDGSLNTVPHNTMPPYLVGTWIQRTARKYFVIPA